jgi:hypothetical protein
MLLDLPTQGYEVRHYCDRPHETLGRPCPCEFWRYINTLYVALLEASTAMQLHSTSAL